MSIYSLRQAVNHPLLVTSKASSGGDDHDTEDAFTVAEDAKIRKLIANYAEGKEDDTDNDEVIDLDMDTPAPESKQTEVEETHMCLFCREEVEAEVILPCYHTG